MEGPGTRPVENETKSSSTRTARDGKKYTYRLHVLQQPLRARACGAGAKSSADRRPVDPPPIVELKIYDNSEHDEKDVTFSMSANYFLFATLEQARVHAHGRVPQDQRQMPVLTGTPVAGMVYLDRPAPAGYFIFPDLSVRHEGLYRLSFNLYEELKDAKDEDATDDVTKANESAQTHVTHRLEVKSQPFTVYSAKKFPGLTESTSLSRVVAEQGCRVRIRRDVRMRRRDNKSGKEWDGYEDETAEARSRMSATPEASGYPALPPPHAYMEPIPRPRSSSNTSHQSLAHSLSLSRRASFQELGQSYHQPSYGTAPHTPQSAYPQSSPYGPSPSQLYSQPPFMHHQSTMQPPPPQYSQSTYQPPPPQHATPSQGYYGYSTNAPPPPMPQSQFGTSQSSYEAAQPQRMSVDYTPSAASDHRRSSTQYAPPPPPPSNYGPTMPALGSQAPPTPTNYPPPAQPVYPNHQAYQPSYGSLDAFGSRPAPLEPVQPPTRTTGATTPMSARPSFNDKLPPLNTTLNMIPKQQHIEAASPSSSIPASSYYTSAQTPLESHKRGFAQVFNDRHLTQPLRHGARPATPGYFDSSIYTATEYEDEDAHITAARANEMCYRRADGSERKRPLHPQN